MEHAVEKTKQGEAKAGPSRGREPVKEQTAMHPMLQLQQQVGNQAVQDLLRAGLIQAKLSVSQPTDPEEQEADSVADHIMRAAGPPGAAACACSAEDEMCDECRQKSGQAISRKAVGPVKHAASHKAIDHVLRSPGQGLDPATRAFFEPRFGHDLSNVRVHTDSSAAESARSINALAYTAGDHLVFAEGQYAPYSTSGTRLLAHELAHVMQQLGGSHPRVHRQKTPTGPTGTDQEYSPANSMRSNIEELQTQALPQFQEAVDTINERAVTVAGDQLLATWQRIEGNYNDVPAIESTTPSEENPATEAKPEDVQRDFKAARTEVLKSVSTQQFNGKPVLGKVSVPADPGNMAAFISEQKAAVAWVVKDTAALIGLLKQDKLEEGAQWQAVGLLRQHLNPWNFAYMQAAVAAASLDSKFQSFAKGPAEGYQTLVETTAQIKLQGEIGPSDEVGLLALIPAESKVRLLQPMSPSEVSGEVYGRADLWQTLLAPFNEAELSGKGGQDWLLMGTELRVDPSMLVDPYAMIFRAAVQAQQRKKDTEGTAYLVATGDRIAVVGNTITYSISWPAGYWPDVNLQWSVDYDPSAVAQGSVPKTEEGPSGLHAAAGASESYGTTFEFSPSVTGTHTVHCQISYGDTVEDLTYAQTVITLEQKTKIELARGYDYSIGSPKDILDELRKELNDTPDTPAYQEKRADLNKRISDIEQSLKEAGSKNYGLRDRIPATYISSADKPLRLPLRLFVGWDPDYNEADRGYNLKLWDYTMQGQPFSVTAQGERIMPTLEALLKTFADDCYYPEGNVIAQISESQLAFSLIHDETLTLPTAGPKLIDEILQLLPPEVLRALSMGALGLAVVTGLAGQEEVAIPLFEVSGYLGGVAAAEELSEKLAHGQFKWDAGTVMQVADVATALIGLGARFELTTTVAGVGRVSLTPALSGLGKGIGLVQIGVVAGIHTTEIVAAVQSKDKDKIISAILRALGDAALLFIAHKASGGGAEKKPLEETPEFVAHDQLKAQGGDEGIAAQGHDVFVTEDGRVYRCSDDCADLRWAFEQILAERPEVTAQLEAIARKPRAQRVAAARELLARLEGLRNIRNLSNAELADRIAQSRGSNVEIDLKLERLRREGIELSTAEILEEPGMGERPSVGGKVPDPFESGNFAHRMYEKLDGMVGGSRVTSEDIPAGAEKEYTIPQTKLPYDQRPRIDRLDRPGETVIEIKPTSQKAKGNAQARGYAELMDRLEPLPGGRKWKWKTVTYDEARVKSFLKDKGVLE